jgi:hypothetical protein
VSLRPYRQYAINHLSIGTSGAGIAMRLDLISPFPLRECVRRLRAATDGVWAISGSKPVQGTVRDTSIRLRRRIFARNSFQCWLSAKLIDDDGQTRLYCTIGLHPFVLVFLEIWIAIVAVVGLTIAMQTAWLWLRGSPLSPNAWLGIVFPLIMAGFAILLLKFGNHLSQEEPAFLLEFLERTIDARVTAET